MKSFFYFLILISASPLWAAQDVTCWEKNCLQKGWTRTDLATGHFSDNQCYREGCRQSGWIVGGSQNLNYYTTCRNSDCFNFGWYEIDRQTQSLIQTITCQKNDCLTYGWATSSRQSSSVTHCTDRDCTQKGWLTTENSGQSIRVYCKTGGCFKEGWIESQSKRPF